MVALYPGGSVGRSLGRGEAAVAARSVHAMSCAASGMGALLGPAAPLRRVYCCAHSLVPLGCSACVCGFLMGGIWLTAAVTSRGRAATTAADVGWAKRVRCRYGPFTKLIGD